MAIGFLRVAKISRNQGATACARMAYVLRTRIYDHRTRFTHDYSRAGVDDLLASGLVAWTNDAQSLAQAMSLAEKRLDACEGRSVILAIPHELTVQQSANLVDEWCRALHRQHGVASAWVIHRPDEAGDERNVHAHVLVTARRSDGSTLSEKARELDDRKTGPAAIEKWRADWGALAELALQRVGNAQAVDMRSWYRRLSAEGLPNQLVEGDEHLGPARSTIERRGYSTSAGTRNRRRRRRRKAAEILIDQRREVIAAERLEKSRQRPKCSAPGIKQIAAKKKLEKTVRGTSRIIGGFFEEFEKLEEIEKKERGYER